MRGVSIREMQLKLDYACAIADWFLDTSDACIARGEFEQALKCNHLAARVLAIQNRDLSCSRIESNLQLLAGVLSERKKQRVIPDKGDDREMWLHVFSEALPYGGHTAMAIRWMKDDLSRRTHSVALLSQISPVPDELVQAVCESGGKVYTADPSESFFSRAEWLRQLAHELANYVVLHIAPDDVIAGVAFGSDGGPPVLLVNHAAHIFWNGARFVDLIVNCRGSKLEESWTRIHRGIPRYATIPIPLLEPMDSNSGRTADLNQKKKDQAKESIGIPKDSVLILTVGDSHKYTPIDALNFIEACEDILREVPEAFVVAVGPEEDWRWRTARDRSGSRLRAFGRQPRSQVAVFHQAADVYIEGFPFGSTTAVLEAGLRGIPVVLAPAQCPPPYGSDGVALDEVLERPRTIEEYRARIILLSRSPAEREYWGGRICDAVTRHHTGSGWRQYVENAISRLPDKHSTYLTSTPVRTPESVHAYWIRFRSELRTGLETSLEYSVICALWYGLRPRLTKAVVRACKDARIIRTGRTIPLPILICLCNFLLPLLPIVLARKIFRLFGILGGAFLLSQSKFPKFDSLFSPRKVLRLYDLKKTKRRYTTVGSGQLG
jgi:glycosyltransferase involved in cell wall biosynthesis